MIKKILYTVLIFLLSFGWGAVTAKYHVFPYTPLRKLYDNIEFALWSKNADLVEKNEDMFFINEEYRKTNVQSLITIDSEEDIIDKRKNLVQFIFAQETLPSSILPSHIEKGIQDKRFSNLGNLKRIDKITVTMDYGLESISYFFHPLKSNKRLIIYHQGHGGGFVLGKPTISYFLENGYFVIALAMPLKGMNNTPIVNLERFGRFKIRWHDHMKFLDLPIKFFLEPVITTLNYATKEYHFRDISMVGLSGGAWTTILAAAIDPRISSSFPVSGPYPLFLTSNCDKDYGDFEVTYPPLYEIANYPELYILGSYGKGRKQIQIFNKYDTDYCGGVKYKTYDGVICDIIERIGKGKFRVFSDDTHKGHKISKHALKIILDELISYEKNHGAS